MELIENYSKRSIEYLIPVLEKEQAIALALLHDKEMLVESLEDK
jgi:hypothetical protein